MEIINYNQKYREELHRFVEKGFLQGIDVEESLSNYAAFLYIIELSSNKLKQIGRDYLLITAFLDAFKLYSYKQKENLNEDEDFLGILCDIENIDDLKATVSADPDFLMKILRACNQFAEMNILGRIIVQKSLSTFENEWLSERFPIHAYDLKSYDIPVNLNFLINAFQEKKEYQNNVIMIEFEEAILMSIYGFLRNLIKVDYQNAIKLLLELGKIDYAYLKYLETEGIEESQKRIYFYEQNSLDVILYRLLQDQDFLRNVIESFKYVFIQKEYNGVKLTIEKINTKETEEVRKKLSLQKKEN